MQLLVAAVELAVVREKLLTKAHGLGVHPMGAADREKVLELDGLVAQEFKTGVVVFQDQLK